MADRLDELQSAIHAFVAERDRASAHRRRAVILPSGGMRNPQSISAKAMIPVSADE